MGCRLCPYRPGHRLILVEKRVRLIGKLSLRHVHDRPRTAIQTLIADIGYDSDDLPQGLVFDSGEMPRPMRIRSLRGSPLFQYFFAKLSLITATAGDLSSSRSVNVRPFFNGILNTSKNPGETIDHPASTVGVEGTRPGISKFISAEP